MGAEAVLDDAGLIAAPVIGGQEAVMDSDVEGLLGVLRVYRNPDADGRLEVEVTGVGQVSVADFHRVTVG